VEGEIGTTNGTKVTNGSGGEDVGWEAGLFYPKNGNG
jgi:hypothetical protein